MAVYNFCLAAAAVAVRVGVCEAEQTLSSADSIPLMLPIFRLMSRL